MDMDYLNTKFDFSDAKFDASDDSVITKCTVKNIGKMAGMKSYKCMSDSKIHL